MVKHLDGTSKAYGMEMSSEETQTLANNNTEGATNDVTVSGQTLETVSKLKYLEIIIKDEGSRPAILSCIAQAIAALTKLKSVWKDKNIALHESATAAISNAFNLPIHL